MITTSKIDVLDKGFVRLVDHMGSDIDIEQAARVSYGKGTRSISDTTKLIRRLVKDNHSSPLEQVEFKFHIKLPLFVLGQIVRHRTASLNVRSYRYSEFEEEFCYLPYERYVKQSKTNKQGSDIEPIFSKSEYYQYMNYQDNANGEQLVLYKTLLENDCAREVARIHLPQSAYTEMFWKIDLRNLLHFLKLRLAKDAQPETQAYAKAMKEFVKEICPITWQAFVDYELNSIKLTQKELKSVLAGHVTHSSLIDSGYNSKEAQELLSKLTPIEEVL